MCIKRATTKRKPVALKRQRDKKGTGRNTKYLINTNGRNGGKTKTSRCPKYSSNSKYKWFHLLNQITDWIFEYLLI